MEFDETGRFVSLGDIEEGNRNGILRVLLVETIAKASGSFSVKKSFRYLQVKEHSE